MIFNIEIIYTLFIFLLENFILFEFPIFYEQPEKSRETSLEQL